MSIIILSIAGVVFFLLAFSFRHSIYVISIRLIYGEYHIRYMDLVNADSYFRSAYYVKGELSNQISNFKSALNKQDKFSTNLPVYFQNIGYGVSAKDLIAILGKPISSDIIDMGEIRVVSLEYNIQAHNVVDKYIYYLYNDRYYLGEFIFNKIQVETTNQILDNINSKYQSSFHGEDQFVITDKKGNYLNYKDLGYRISVSYFNGENADIVHLMASQKRQRDVSKSYYDYRLDVQRLSF